MTISVQAPAP